VEKSQILNGSQVQVGDAVIGLASSGVHSNGYSLVRKIIADRGFSWGDRLSELDESKTLGEIFLTPTRIYVKPILGLLRSDLNTHVHALAHITGGGLPENLPRCLGAGKSVEILPQSWQIPNVFNWLAQQGEVAPHAMFETFNMGIGMVVIVSSDRLEQTLSYFQTQHITSHHIGWVIEGNGTVEGLDNFS
jgi:phosphoribosylformylglycinamidine cyclo-ligase